MEAGVSLGASQRRVLLLAELFRQRTGQPPSWSELRRPLGMEPVDFGRRMRALRDTGYVTFTDEPRSLRVTEKGIRAAVNGGRV
jgi:hypothetical protein